MINGKHNTLLSSKTILSLVQRKILDDLLFLSII